MSDVRRIPNLVRQTTPTNCFRACVAMVLDLPIEEVPEACDGAKWDWDAFQDWLAGRGLQMIEITFANGGTIYPVRKPVRCIITGKSHRECTSGQHAVVGSLLGLEGFSLDNDPHPSDLWIDGEPTHAGFFVPINPVAAPTMLEALQQCLINIERDEFTHGRNFGAGNVARDAIEKATGIRPAEVV